MINNVSYITHILKADGQIGILNDSHRPDLDVQ